MGIYPRLKQTVRLKKLPAFCWAAELLSDYGAPIAPMEAFLLTLCTGEYSLDDLCYLMERLLAWDREQAGDYVKSTLKRLRLCVEWQEQPGVGNSPYEPADFLYTPSTDPAREQYETPVEMVLVLTNRCNFRCIYCYNDSGAVSIPDELTGPQWMDVIEQAAEMGVVKCTLTGGEPMLSPYFFQILEALHRHRILVYICTNGSLIDDHAVERLRKVEQPFLQISMDSAHGAAHDRLTLAPGTLPAVQSAVRKLVRAGIRVHVKAVVLPETMDDIGALIDCCHQLGVSQLIIDRYDLCLAGRGDNRFFLTREQEQAVQETVDRKRKSVGNMGISTVFPPRNWAGDEDIVMCGAFLRSFAVMPNGDCPLCEKVSGIQALTVGNLRKLPLREIWASSRIGEILRPHPQKLHPTCRDCEHLPQCGTGCFATKQFFTDDLYAPDPNCWRADYVHNPFLLSASASQRK